MSFAVTSGSFRIVDEFITLLVNWINVVSDTLLLWASNTKKEHERLDLGWHFSTANFHARTLDIVSGDTE